MPFRIKYWKKKAKVETKFSIDIDVCVMQFYNSIEKNKEKETGFSIEVISDGKKSVFE